MNAELTVEEMLEALFEVQSDLFRQEWDSLLCAEEDLDLLLKISDTEAA